MIDESNRGNAVSVKQYDLLVIGGGINGSGVARDAAGRGLKVLLCEQDDLAQHTSSASTKLIHGGLRYLEHYDFSLVRHSLQEREVLWRLAPHIIWPLRFVLPHHSELRPIWLIRLGLFLYDHLGGRKLLPASKRINLQSHVAGEILRPQFRIGFEYSDCWVQDARLVVLNAMDARENGADIHLHTACVDLQRHPAYWLARLQKKHTGECFEIRSRAVVNAAGPWVVDTLKLDQSMTPSATVRLVKGSHIVVRQMFSHHYPYIFQNADGRIIFAIPYEQNYTLIGTTDIEVKGDAGSQGISEDEIAYLCENVNKYFKIKITPQDVVWSFTGVRPLYDDAAKQASKVTRDYNLHLDTDAAPILSVYGGKITTYRKLSEEVMDLLKEPLEFDQANWTQQAPLPGGDLENGDFHGFCAACKKQYPWMPAKLIVDYARHYGSRLHRILAGCFSIDDLGMCFAPGLYACEVKYLQDQEWAGCAEDILWRRTKKGLHVPSGTAEKLDQWLNN